MHNTCMNIGPPITDPFHDLPILEIKTPAEYAFETVREQVKAFEGALEGSQAVGMWVASFGRAMLLQVQTIRQAGQFFVFEGWSEEGEECRVIQHFTQISLMLTRVEPTKERRPMGFVHT